MEDKQLQSIRYKLQKRVRRLNSAEYRQFIPLLKQFFIYFNSSPILCSVRDVLLEKTKKYDIKNTIDKIVDQKEKIDGSTEEEAAALGYEILLRVTTADDPGKIIMCRKKIQRRAGQDLDWYSKERDEAFEMFRPDFLEPFYEYIDEHIDDQHIILYLLKKYKHQCEWFHVLADSTPKCN